MKAEKIQKHMLRRTVVFASHEGRPDWDIVGVIERESMAGAWVVGLSHRKADHWSHEIANIRKATDAERAEFFAWLVADGRDIADGFVRFGGMPRGFEASALRATPAAEPAPACAVGWMFTKPTPDVPEPVATTFTIGQRVRITDRAPLLEKRYVGSVGVVTQVAGPHPSEVAGQPVRIKFTDLPPCWFHAYCLEPAAEPTPEPAATPQHKVGALRVGYSEYTGMADVGRVTSVDDDGDVHIGDKPWCGCCVYEPTPENVARLVEQQRARGIVPELGDLVFALLTGNTVATGLVARGVPAPNAKLLQSVTHDGEPIARALAPTIAAHTLVIRRCPFREVADV